jgi:hypothetical protein
VGAATIRLDVQRRQGGSAKILVQYTGPAFPNKVERAGDRIGGDRQSRGKRLQDDEPERIGSLGKTKTSAAA